MDVSGAGSEGVGKGKGGSLTMAKKNNSVNSNVSKHALKEMKHQKVCNRWKGI